MKKEWQRKLYDAVRLASLILLIFVLPFTLAFKGCGKSGDKPVLQQGYEVSVRVSATGNQAARSVLELYEKQKISLETKDKIFAKLDLIARGGHAFHNALDALKAQYPDGNVPLTALTPLKVLYETNVYTPLVDILDLTGVLPDDQKSLVLTAIQGLKVAVLLMRDRFNLIGAVELDGPIRRIAAYG